MAIDIRLDTKHCEHCTKDHPDDQIVRCALCGIAICSDCTYDRFKFAGTSRVKEREWGRAWCPSRQR